MSPLNADTIFNGYVSANVLFALDSLGALKELAIGLNISEFCARDNLDRYVVDALVSAAADVGHIVVEDSTARLTSTGAEAAGMIGFFTWGVGGYHDIFAHAADIARGARRFGRDLYRDEAMVAQGSAQADIALMRDILDEVIAGIEFDTLADLGSGTGARLARFVGARARTRGLGLDISGPATELAAGVVERAGLSDRVQPVQADVTEVLFGGVLRDRCAQAEVVMSFMFLHDLLAEQTTRVEVVPKLREAFPRAHTFLIADTTVRPRHEGATTLPVFSSGFELAHALMGIPLYTREEYERLFIEGGLEIKEIVPFGAPYTYLFILEAC
ncbi:MAG: SAM-dependent methyltransferase [Candidatus Dormibacteraceae bacterium]